MQPVGPADLELPIGFAAARVQTVRGNRELEAEIGDAHRDVPVRMDQLPVRAEA